MGDLLIRGIPDEMKKELAEAARAAGHSLSDEVKRRLGPADDKGAGVANATNNSLDDLRAVFAGIPADEREQFARVMDEVVAARKKDFGNPFSFDE